MLSTNLKTKLVNEFGEIKKGKNPKVTKDLEAVIVSSGESGDPIHPTKLHDTEERTKFGIQIFKIIEKLGGHPTLILNGTNAQNDSMAKIAKEARITNTQFVKNPQFPKASTLTQFQGLKNLPFKSIAIVTHAYHAPRVKRYAEKYLPKNCSLQLFLLDRDKITEAQIKEEINKIRKYF